MLHKHFYYETVYYLVMMLKLLGLSVKAVSSPGPDATTLLGSHPSATETLNGLLGTGVSSYITWTLWTPEIHTETDSTQFIKHSQEL